MWLLFFPFITLPHLTIGIYKWRKITLRARKYTRRSLRDRQSMSCTRNRGQCAHENTYAQASKQASGLPRNDKMTKCSNFFTAALFSGLATCNQNKPRALHVGTICVAQVRRRPKARVQLIPFFPNAITIWESDFFYLHSILLVWERSV